MGRDVSAIGVSTQDRRRYREKVQRCLEAFTAMLRENRFASDPPSMGMEIELNLVDEDGRPAMRNAAVLDAISGDQWSTELAQFNIEVNLPPFPLAAKSLNEYSFNCQLTGVYAACQVEPARSSARKGNG